GIDGVAISIQGTLCTDADEAAEILSVGKNHVTEFHFFQSKTSESMDYGDVSKFLDADYDCCVSQEMVLGDDIKSLVEVNDELHGAAAKVSPTLRCFYCTTGTGQVSEVIAKLINTNKARFDELNIFSKIQIECVGAKVIQNGFRSATNSTSAKINFPKAVTMPSHDKVD